MGLSESRSKRIYQQNNRSIDIIETDTKSKTDL